jgi:hypothetical protein
MSLMPSCCCLYRRRSLQIPGHKLSTNDRGMYCSRGHVRHCLRTEYSGQYFPWNSRSRSKGTALETSRTGRTGRTDTQSNNTQSFHAYRVSTYNLKFYLSLQVQFPSRSPTIIISLCSDYGLYSLCPSSACFGLQMKCKHKLFIALETANAVRWRTHVQRFPVNKFSSLEDLQLGRVPALCSSVS